MFRTSSSSYGDFHSMEVYKQQQAQHKTRCQVPSNYSQPTGPFIGTSVSRSTYSPPQEVYAQMWELTVKPQSNDKKPKIQFEDRVRGIHGSPPEATKTAPVSKQSILKSEEDQRRPSYSVSPTAIEAHRAEQLAAKDLRSFGGSALTLQLPSSR